MYIYTYSAAAYNHSLVRNRLQYISRSGFHCMAVLFNVTLLVDTNLTSLHLNFVNGSRTNLSWLQG